MQDGDSWAKARRGYELTLAMQTRSIVMMSGWIGGAFVNRDKKGDPGGRLPIEVVPPDAQRKALNFVLETVFRDDAFGLTPELLAHMSVDKWFDGDGWHVFEKEAAWPVHDRIMAIQAVALTRLINPATLNRIYDNEFRVSGDRRHTP